MSVPFVDLRPLYERHRAEVDDAIARVVGSQRFIMGDEVAAFEREMAEGLGAGRICLGTSSGTSALTLALLARGIGPGDEVVVPAYTFMATASAVSLTGATPVFVDVIPRYLSMDPVGLAASLSERTKLVIPVHLMGISADWDALADVLSAAGRPDVALVEDAAQAQGARYKNRQIGTLGTVSCFSFFPAKNLGCFGDGGMVATDDAAQADLIGALRVHGRTAAYHHEYLGMNARLDALQAAILRTRLTHLAGWIDERRANAARYRQAFVARGLEAHLELPPEDDATYFHTYNQFNVGVLANRRDALRAHLTEHGIGTAIYYPVPLPFQPCYRSLGHDPSQFPVSLAWADMSLALPIYPGLAPSAQDQVIDCVAGFFRRL